LVFVLSRSVILDLKKEFLSCNLLPELISFPFSRSTQVASFCRPSSLRAKTTVSFARVGPRAFSPTTVPGIRPTLSLPSRPFLASHFPSLPHPDQALLSERLIGGYRTVACEEVLFSPKTSFSLFVYVTLSVRTLSACLYRAPGKLRGTRADNLFPFPQTMTFFSGEAPSSSFTERPPPFCRWSKGGKRSLSSSCRLIPLSLVETLVDCALDGAIAAILPSLFDESWLEPPVSARYPPYGGHLVE